MLDQICRKNEECEGRSFHFEQCLGTLKGQNLEKIEWGLGLGSSLKKFFWVIFKKHCFLRIWRIRIAAKNEEKLSPKTISCNLSL
jgi:hypothetical protein